MKRSKFWTVIPTALAVILAGASAARSQPLQLAPGFSPDPLVVSGTSGGSQTRSGCGTVSATPNHVIRLSQDFSYLRFKVEGGGQPTLFIESPSGNTCIPADSLSGGIIEAPGYWEQGTYSLYVGNLAGSQHRYTLSITQQR